MTPLPFFQVDAFAEKPFTGNPAAVMPLDHWLDDEMMQAIAAENNLSETAFTVPSERDDADYDLRWFTPTVEVNLCGHATLASAHILLKGEQVRFATKSGILTVTREDGPAEARPARLLRRGRRGAGPARSAGPRRTYRPSSAAAAMARRSRCWRTRRRCAPSGPTSPRCGKIDRLVMVTAPGDEHAVTSRVFAAYHGIDEDPVTGAAHAALVPFWAERLGRNHFTALQASKRTGVLHCELKDDRVILGGHAVTVIEGHFQL